jgi:hypothetical protein
MSKPTEAQPTEAPPITPPPATITHDALSALIATAVRAELANIMTAKSPDQRMTEAMASARGQDRPAAPEFLVACRSPITNATFTARLLDSKAIGKRVVELLNYERPEGWDRKKVDGGLVPDGDEMPLKNADGSPSKKYAMWLYNTYWQRDVNALGGKPLPDQWRVDYATPEGAVVLTKEQLAKLGITPAEIAAAVSVDDKAAE